MIVRAGGLMCSSRPSVWCMYECTSSVYCERAISRTLWGIFPKLYTNVHSDSMIRWFNFGGHCGLKSWAQYIKTVLIAYLHCGSTWSLQPYILWNHSIVGSLASLRGVLQKQPGLYLPKWLLCCEFGHFVHTIAPSNSFCIKIQHSLNWFCLCSSPGLPD